MAYKLTWLADVLRAAGCTVVEEPGWQTRGRSDMGTVKGVILHHTGAGSAKGLLSLIRDGRGAPNPLSGPLSQLFLTDKGVYHVIAAGACNHAGNGSWHGITVGNKEAIGIEAMNAGDGKDEWEPEQMNAYVVGVAAILEYIKADALMAAGHKEYAKPRGRKIDPSFDMDDFREQVEAQMNRGGKSIVVKAPALTLPKRAMLKKGDRGESVRELQRCLIAAGYNLGAAGADGDFGKATDAAVRSFQLKNGLLVDGKVGPATWKLLLE